MKKYLSKYTRVIITVVFVILIGAVAVQSALISALFGQLTHEQSARVWDTKLIYACYNNEIHPCDDSGVSEWNKQNPDKAITTDYLRSPEF